MPRQYSSESRQRALRLLDTMMEASDISEFEAIKSVASKIGVSEESVRRWRRKSQGRCRRAPGYDKFRACRDSPAQTQSR
jgi:transposase